MLSEAPVLSGVEGKHLLLPEKLGDQQILRCAPDDTKSGQVSG